MTSILLHEYVEQVEKLIDANRLVEAIEHCRHILHHYPRHIDTYRVLGKAMLEKQDYDAADLFLRILGADPNDFISHVGLSIIYKEQSQYDQALWHLERAYEIQPYNVAIQGELRQLYAVEKEIRPGIIPLTAGALARLYMQGELYQQAIAELRRVLAEEPDRMDLQVLLAEALWRDDQRIDAEEVCLKILEELPNCIVLNAILAEIWLHTGRIPEAQKYLQRLHGLTWQTQKSLDKESIPGQAFITDGAFTLPIEAPLEYLETGSVVSQGSPAPTDDWVREVTFEDSPAPDARPGQVVLEPESGMHSYDWLADIGSETDNLEKSEPAQITSETDWFSQEKAKDTFNLSTGELNADWLADLRGTANEEDESGFQPLDLSSQSGLATPSEDADWFADEDQLSEELFAELNDTAVPPTDDTAVDSDHDWLNDLADADQAASPKKKGSSNLQIDATNLMDDTLMDWTIESDPHVVKESKTPLWLSQMAGEELDAVELDPDEALDWLAEPVPDVAPTDEAADSTDALAPTEDAPAAELDDALDWLSELPDEPLDGNQLLNEAWDDGEEDEYEYEDEEEDEDEEAYGPTAVLDPAEQAPHTLILTETADLGGADDWLDALTEGGIDENLAWDDDPSSQTDEEMNIVASTEQLAALSDADDWLESAAADLDAIMNIPNSEDESFANLLIPDMEDEQSGDIPDWLYTDSLDTSEAETAMSSENNPQEKPQPEEPQIDPAETADQDAELDALDWLNELTNDDEAVPSQPPIATEGMPSWLAGSEPEAGVEVVDEWDSSSADIPDWLQEPVALSDLDDDTLADEPPDSGPVGLTGLLSKIDMADDEALPLDDMDSLLADWADEDADGSLADLLGDFALDEDETPADSPSDGFDFADFGADFEAETATPTDNEEEPSEVGLTGLLSNLSLDQALPETAESEEDDFLSGFLSEVDDDDLSDFLGGETAEAESDDALSLAELDLENVSLTALFSNMDEAEAPEPHAATDPLDDDDWLADLTSMTDDDDDFDLLETPEEAEEAVGLTGMLANLWPDEITDERDGRVETAVDSMALDEPAADELGLTELLAGIDYSEEMIDSRPELPDFGEPVEPSLTEILSGMAGDEAEEADDALDFEDVGPISAEDTTWLTQLEADTGSLREQTEAYDMAEETGLDWLTLPDEPEAEEPETAAEPDALPVVPEVVQELDSTPEDWDDAMSWLEELAAQQEDPVGELPSVAENMLNEELDTDEALKTTAPMDTENMDWLDELTSDTPAEPDELYEESSLFEAAPLPEAAPLTDLPPASNEAEDDAWADLGGDGELSWLDELATDMLPDTAVPSAETRSDTSDFASLDAAPLDEDEAEDEADIWLSELTAGEDDLMAEPDLFGDDFAGLDDLDEGDELETAVAATDLDWLDAVDDEADEFDETLFETVDDAAPEAAVTLLNEVQDPDEIHRIAGVTDALKADDGLDEVEADLEDALAWLDELDEEPTIEPLDEVPPTIITPPQAHTLSQVDEDDAPETVLLPPEPDALTLALNRLEQQVRDEGIDVPETAVLPLNISDEDLFAALDWIEAAAADQPQEAAPETDPATAALALDDVDTLEDDPEAWLEELLGGADLDVEMEPPPIKPSEDAMFVTDVAPVAEPEEIAPPAGEATVVETADSLLDDLELEEMPEDPDAAVAWLDQMVSGDALLDIEMEPPPIKPSEDAMFATDHVAEIAAEPEPELLAEPDDFAADDLMRSLEDDPEAWLEQMLSGEMTLDIDMEPPPIKPSEDAMFVTDHSPVAEPKKAERPVEPEPEPVEVPVAESEDEDEALDEFNFADMEADPEAWLEQMLSGEMALDVDMEPPPIKPSEDAVFATGNVTPAAPEVAAPEAMAEADDIIAEVPDDPDEAMVWLEQLAARQGADLQELPSVTDVEAEPAMPDWMTADLDELSAEADLDLAVAELDELAEAPALDMAESITRSGTDTGPLIDDDVDSELPDWLSSRDNRPVVGETDWLRNLPDVDMDSWLSAEAEAAAIEPEEDVQLPDTGPLRSSPPVPTNPLPDEDLLFEPVIEPSSGAYSVDSNRLGVAQAALANGRIQDALSQFKQLVAEGSGMMAVIAELERAADTHPQVPALFQVLGDAYMRNGQLQKALASYRSALNQM
ncbi:MAG: tetratricopeptide repeat protein [Anaerolineaceae bacterium]|nr:tetratricopeptide repeat protein [Anaerolineaceae bacterium]